MTASAWFMLAVTWTVVLAFTGRFFMQVLRTPMRQPETGTPGPTESAQTAEERADAVSRTAAREEVRDHGHR